MWEVMRRQGCLEQPEGLECQMEAVRLGFLGRE